MLITGLSHGQIVINEFDPSTGTVELKNTGTSGVNVGSYRLCSFPTYTTVNNLTLESGAYMLMPGDILAVSGHSMGQADDELGLYITGAWSSSADILDYVEWGTSNHQRSTVAQGAGIWTVGDFIAAPMAGTTVSWLGTGNGTADWEVGTSPTFGEENFGGCDAIGGTLEGGAFSFCVGDGMADNITDGDITLSGNSGTNSQWVVTEADGTIAGLPPSYTDADFDGAGAGVCSVWHISYEDGLTGLEVGAMVADLDGCYSLSNNIEVTRNQPVGGTLEGGSFTFCVGDGMADNITDGDITLSGNSGTNSQWVVTEADGTIAGLPPTYSAVDFDGAGAGVCSVWYISYEDSLSGLEVGAMVADLEGCYSLSNNIEVTRNQPEGGTISTADPTTICAGDEVDDLVEVTFTDVAGTNSLFVITDENLEIIATQSETTFNFEGAGEGICLIWHLAYEDDVVLEGVTNAADLSGCFSLSNSIAVTRLVGDDCDCLANGGEISTDDPTSVCAGDGAADMVTVSATGVQGTNSIFVVTDEDGGIIDTQTENVFNFEGAGAGICLVWHLSYEDDVDLTGISNASELSGCFDLSNAITITRNQPEGGTLAGGPFSFCVGDGMADNIADGDITLSGNSGTNSQWVVTEADGTIAGLPPTYSAADFDGAGAGVCSVWYISYEDSLSGLEVGAMVADLEGCFSLSNNIEVTRVLVDAGTVTTEDGETTVMIIVGDGVADEITFSNNSESTESYMYVITDEDNNILGTTDDSNDFEGAAAGICRVWGVSYSGELTAEAGTNASAISSTGCWSLSADFVTIDREMFDNVSEENGLDVTIYPTVFENELFIIGLDESFNFSLTSISGKLVYNEKFNSGVGSIQLSSIAPGIYIGTIEIEGKSSTFRVIKQ